MAKLSMKPGSTDQTVLLFIQDSSSTTGAGLTGLVYNSAGLVCYYARPGAVAAQLALATQTVTGAHSDGGFVEVDATNLPGVYRLDLSDAIVAAGVRSSVVMLKGAANMVPCPLEIDLDAEVNASASAVASVTGAVGSVTGAVGSVTGNVGGNVAGSVASVTAGVTLADDAITSAKFDESTAYPLKSADTGATAVARTGADSDTLETLSDQIDAVPTLAEFVTDDTGETTAAAGSVAKLAQGSASMTEADIWAYATRTLTQSAAQIAAVVAGSTLTVQRGDSLSAALTGLGSITGRLKLWWTVKGDTASADSAALIMIEETAGLMYLNGAAGTAIQGDITVDDESAGDITITVAAASTAALPPGSYSYDVQWATATGAIHTLTSGTVQVVADVTRTTTST